MHDVYSIPACTFVYARLNKTHNFGTLYQVFTSSNLYPGNLLAIRSKYESRDTIHHQEYLLVVVCHHTDSVTASVCIYIQCAVQCTVPYYTLLPRGLLNSSINCIPLTCTCSCWRLVSRTVARGFIRRWASSGSSTSSYE